MARLSYIRLPWFWFALPDNDGDDDDPVGSGISGGLPAKTGEPPKVITRGERIEIKSGSGSSASKIDQSIHACSITRRFAGMDEEQNRRNEYEWKRKL
jgi:hypothetical protein